MGKVIWLRHLLLLLLGILAAPAALMAATTSQPIATQASSPRLEEQSQMQQQGRASASELDQHTYRLATTLRCLVCSGQTVADSNAPWAEDVRAFVHQKLAENWSESQIMDYLVARYGAEILMTTPKQSGTIALWLIPPILLLVIVFWGKRQLRR
jgi:cytochrome c-type biogenesis protein CcmH/NrfF